MNEKEIVCLKQRNNQNYLAWLLILRTTICEALLACVNINTCQRSAYTYPKYLHFFFPSRQYKKKLKIFLQHLCLGILNKKHM